MPRLRLFAAAREAAGTGATDVPGRTVGEVLDEACRRYGDRFADVVAASRVWVDGEPAEPGDDVPAGAEVAVLPPVSGGADAAPAARARGAGATGAGSTAGTGTGSSKGKGGSNKGSSKGSSRGVDGSGKGSSTRSGKGAGKGSSTRSGKGSSTRSSKGATGTRTGDGGTARTGTGGRQPAATGSATSGSTAAVRTGPTPLVARLFEPVDSSGPKAAIALAWVALQVLALLGGRWALAVLFGLVGAVAGLHTARTWRRQRIRANRAVAGLTPLAVPLAAAVGTASAGLVVLGAVAASGVAALLSRRRRVPVVVVAGTTVRCWLGPAAAAASVVVVDRVSTEAAASLLLLLAGYDVAAYVWGAGGGTGPLVGRVAGILTVGVLTFALSTVHLVFSLPPFQQTAAVWVFGGMAATLAPLGQLAASAMLPAAAAQAPALRRLDSLLLAGPAWAFALWGYTA